MDIKGIAWQSLFCGKFEKTVVSFVFDLIFKDQSVSEKQKKLIRTERWFDIISAVFIILLCIFLFLPQLAFIILSSITSVKDGGIPLTFILVAIIYIGGQLIDGLTVKDNVSNLTHIIGGVVGACCGMALNKKQ